MAIRRSYGRWLRRSCSNRSVRASFRGSLDVISISRSWLTPLTAHVTVLSAQIQIAGVAGSWNDGICGKYGKRECRPRANRRQIDVSEASRPPIEDWIFKMTYHRCILAIFSVVLTACVQQYPSDLRLEEVFVADVSKLAGYRAAFEAGMIPRPFSLVITLSTSASFPYGASTVDGFCGERQGPGHLGDGNFLPAAEIAGEPVSAGGNDKNVRRLRYFAFVPIVYRPAHPDPDLANFDLRSDDRDICLHTGRGNYTEVQASNVVRVPRSLIEKALHESPRMNVPLKPQGT